MFITGDVVSIRSGGPNMTVVGHNDNGDVRVVWYGPETDYSMFGNTKNCIQHFSFPEPCLVLKDSPQETVEKPGNIEQHSQPKTAEKE